MFERVAMRSGPSKKPTRAKNKLGPDLAYKAVLKSLLALLPPKLSPHLEKLGLEVIELGVVSVDSGLTIKITIDKPGWIDPAREGELSGEPTGQSESKSESESEPDPRCSTDGSGVTIDDCVAVSRLVTKLLGEMDPDSEPEFSLEVSSPGLDRPLKTLADYERFSGRRVKIKLRLDGKLTRLTARMDASPLRLTTKQGELPFNLADVVSCKLVPEI
jgi:ribosome maturation factor RimP